MPDAPLYLTTPIFYANAEPHIGHTYTMVVADTLARFWRARGRSVFVVTGSDEHGDKIAQVAAEHGIDPTTWVDRMSVTWKDTWRAVGLGYDHYVRTTDPSHMAFVRKVLADIHARGDITFDRYTGLYCYGCERFYQERELVNGLCPDHRTPPAEIAEENYFFRMEKYQERLLRLLEERPELVSPDGYRREVLALLREPIGNLCISRPKTRLTWGIELPFDDRYVTYVWFDALLSYVSAIQAAGRPDLWEGVHHLIAKDIVKPHAIYWPTMLMAAGIPMYQQLHVHGYWQMGGDKMSKSLGNIVRPRDVQERYGMDAYRFYVLRDKAYGGDADFSEEGLVTRLNADLANGLGNLASRVLAMQQRYFQGAVQPLAPEPVDLALRQAFTDARRELDAHVVDFAFHRALEALWRALDHANKYVTATAPFSLAKTPAGLPRVGAILHELCEALRVTAQLIEPFMPETAAKLWIFLDLPTDQLMDLALPWGQAFAPGHRTQKADALFPRIDAA
jgi:methionyl-tRNA synthetase